MTEISFMWKSFPGPVNRPDHFGIQPFEAIAKFFTETRVQTDFENMDITQGLFIFGKEKGRFIALKTERMGSFYRNLSTGGAVNKQPAGNINGNDRRACIIQMVYQFGRYSLKPPVQSWSK